MKRAIILFLFALMATVLFGCQPEKEAVEAVEVGNETEGEGMEGLLGEAEIAQVELSEVKGINPVVYEETDKLKIFHNLFSSAEKEPGTVNKSDLEFYLKVVMASLMKIEDTHTIYTVTLDEKRSLAGLINR